MESETEPDVMRADEDAPQCPRCNGELIQYEDGPEGVLECAWCDEDE